MRGGRLIWKLMAIHCVVIVGLMAIVWLSVDYLAAGYFTELIKKYHISPDTSHGMFVGAVHRYLIWATLGGLVLAGLFSFLLTNRALKPLIAMTRVTRRISAGDYSVQVRVRSRDEVGQLAEAFNRMAKNLDRMESLRRQLTIDIAHELRTPLTNMRGYLEALVDRVIRPDRKTLRVLQNETLRLVQLTEDIMKLARADAARRTLHLEEHSLIALIREEARPLARRFAAKRIRPVLRLPRRDVRVMADRHMLGQVIRNLLDNAHQYTPEGGAFRLVVRPGERAVSAAFINTVRTFDPESLPFLFERFYRGEKSRSRLHGGAGIGLAIVKELVEAHGGRVWADLPEDEFRIGFSLPLAGASPAPAA